MKQLDEIQKILHQLESAEGSNKEEIKSALENAYEKIKWMDGQLRVHAALAEGEQERKQSWASAVRNFLKSMRCPDCDGEGYIVHQISTPACCGWFDSSGECCGQPIERPDEVVEPCQWCGMRQHLIDGYPDNE